MLQWLFVLTVGTLVGCAGNPNQLPDNLQTCLPAQDRPSCFYIEASQQEHQKLLIFVHGVFGSVATTWGSPQKPSFWPAMVATDPRFVDYDLYLINYRTPYIGQAPNIHEIASNELGRILSRKIFDRYDEIYIIAHSMGGLIAKSILTQLQGQNVTQLRQIKGVVFLSTPAQGADLAPLVAWFSLNPQLGNMERASLNAYIASLEDQWIQLLENRNKSNAEFPQAYCAYETLRTGAVFVVPRELASSRCDGPFHPMPFNHFGMAEPTRSDDDPYLWVMAKILDAGTSTVIRRRAEKLLQSAEKLMIAGDQIGARQTFNESRALYRSINDRIGLSHVLVGLAQLEQLLGHNDQARNAYMEAQTIVKGEGNRRGEAVVLIGLGNV